MSDKEFDKRLTRLREDIDKEGVRIRRYTMDPRLKKPALPDKPDPNRELREQLEATWKATWKRWFALKGSFRALPPSRPTRSPPPQGRRSATSTSCSAT